MKKLGKMNNLILLHIKLRKLLKLPLKLTFSPQFRGHDQAVIANRSDQNDVFVGNLQNIISEQTPYSILLITFIILHVNSSEIV